MWVNDLIANYPVLYHMAAKGSWTSIRRHGLLSTSSLLNLYKVRGKRRIELETHHRAQTEVIRHRRYGTAEIRDQKPMSDNGLRRALTGGLTPRHWYILLNSKVFFWTSKARLHRLLCARAYRNDAHDVLIVDTARLIRAHSKRVCLCPINSGATKPFPHARGRDTFRRIGAYPWTHWVNKRGIPEAVVEVAFEDGVPDIKRFVWRVVRMRQKQELKTLFKR